MFTPIVSVLYYCCCVCVCAVAPPGKMDLGGIGSGGSKKKKQPPRLPIGKTPVTPGVPLVTTPLSTPTPTPTPT